ncbi:MAG: hypothetical protein AB7G37_10735 [Solirubrobacteraceae bacterium]
MHHHLDLTLDSRDPSALQRVLVLCGARRCAVTDLTFRRRPTQTRLSLSFEATPQHARVFAERARGLVGVTEVVAAAAPVPAP